jgi:hypothetical protein
MSCLRRQFCRDYRPRHRVFRKVNEMPPSDDDLLVFVLYKSTVNGKQKNSPLQQLFDDFLSSKLG